MILSRLCTLQRTLGIKSSLISSLVSSKCSVRLYRVESKVRINGLSQQERGYKNFGHKRQITPWSSVLFGSFIFIIFVGNIIDWRWIRMIYLYYTGQLVEKEVQKGEDSKDVQHNVKNS